MNKLDTDRQGEYLVTLRNMILACITLVECVSRNAVTDINLELLDAIEEVTNQI